MSQTSTPNDQALAKKASSLSASTSKPPQQTSSFHVPRPTATENNFFPASSGKSPGSQHLQGIRSEVSTGHRSVRNNNSSMNDSPNEDPSVDLDGTTNKNREENINKEVSSGTFPKPQSQQQQQQSSNRSSNVLTPVTSVSVTRLIPPPSAEQQISENNNNNTNDNNNDPGARSMMTFPSLSMNNSSRKDYLSSLTQYPYDENSIINIPDSYFKYYRLPMFLVCSAFVVACIVMSVIFIFVGVLDFQDRSKSHLTRWLPALGPVVLLIIGIALSFFPEKIYITFDRRQKELCYIRYRVGWFCLSRTAVVKFRHITGIETRESSTNCMNPRRAVKYDSIILKSSKVRNNPLFATSFAPSHPNGYDDTTSANISFTHNPLEGLPPSSSSKHHHHHNNAASHSTSFSSPENSCATSPHAASVTPPMNVASRTGAPTGSRTKRVVSISASPVDSGNFVPPAARKRRFSHFAELDPEDEEFYERSLHRSHNNSVSLPRSHSTQEGRDDEDEDEKNNKQDQEKKDNNGDDDEEEKEFILDEVEESESEQCRTAWILYLRSIGVQM